MKGKTKKLFAVILALAMIFTTFTAMAYDDEVASEKPSEIVNEPPGEIEAENKTENAGEIEAEVTIAPLSTSRAVDEPATIPVRKMTSGGAPNATFNFVVELTWDVNRSYVPPKQVSITTNYGHGEALVDLPDGFSGEARIVEVKGDEPGWTYDDKVFILKIRNGEVTQYWEHGASGIEVIDYTDYYFYNVYKREPNLVIYKDTGNPGHNSTFEFLVEFKSTVNRAEGSPIPPETYYITTEEGKGSVPFTVPERFDGEVFISEVEGNAPGWTYDDKVYVMNFIGWTYNGTFLEGEPNSRLEAIVFNNKYTPSPAAQGSPRGSSPTRPVQNVIPDSVVPLAPEPVIDEPVVVIDTPVPLADIPQTDARGLHIFVYLMLMGLSLLTGLTALRLKTNKR